MKKPKPENWYRLDLWLIIMLVISITAYLVDKHINVSLKDKHKPINPITILSISTERRDEVMIGSVKYIQNGDTIEANYLNERQIDSLMNLQ